FALAPAMPPTLSLHAALPISYLPPRNLMADVSEFRAVNGVSATMYQQARPLLCALPSTDLLINVNTIQPAQAALLVGVFSPELRDRKSTRLNSSHVKTSYAVY